MNKLYIILYITIVTLVISCTSNSYYKNSLKLKKGMNINETIKLMDGQPTSISEIEHLNDSSDKILFIYIDSKKHFNIHIYFGSNLKISEVVYLD